MSFHNMHFYACCNNLLYELYNLDQNKYFLSIVYLFNNKITYNKYIYICTRFLSCLYFLVLPNCSAWEATPSQQFSQCLLLQWYMFSYQTPASSFNELTLFNKLPKSSPLKWKWNSIWNSLNAVRDFTNSNLSLKVLKNEQKCKIWLVSLDVKFNNYNLK